ncbi:MAG: tetratricopeptide repeat protein [Bacteroidales bacterium]|jgi:tetratricopeptide (TPR) repeat protein|nr:tetratricopeptide repeat protein [Bacteroidales bacterium]MDY0196460.1 tetratricopeptide repeat protein [Tenuifilaceae bacterium]
MKTNKVKFLILAITLVLSLPFISAAQTVKEAVEAYNSGASMLKENPAGALEKLYQALEISEELDYDGQETKLLAQSLIPKAHQQLAMNFYRDKNLPETLDQLEKARKTAKEYGDNGTLARVDKIIPQLYNQMGNSEYRDEKFEKAIEFYLKSIEIKADYPDPYLGIALSYEKQENFDSMLEYLKKTIEVANSVNDINKADDAQKKAKAYLLKNGDSAQKDKKYDEAIEFFTKVLEFDKVDGTIYFLLAVNYSETKNWDKVVDNSKLALEYANGTLDKAGIYYQMGTAYQKLGKNTEACEAYSNASGSYSAAAEYQMKEVLKCN